MANEAAEFSQFAAKYSAKALAARRQMAVDVQSKLFDIVDELAVDPTGKPHRVRPLSRDGRIFLYSHPSPPFEITYEVDQNAKILYFLHFAVPVLQMAKPLFISYSHEDKEWLDKLKDWLKPLEQRGQVKIWDDTEIKAGDQWKEEIEKSLDSAKVALLLVSQNFIASDFIGREELPKLLQGAAERNVKILWVAVSFSTYEDTEIQRFQAVNDPQQPLDTLPEPMQNKVLTEIYKRIKATIEG